MPEAAEDKLTGHAVARPLLPPQASQSSATVQDVFRQGLTLFQRSELAAAEQNLRHVLQLQPAHFDALHLLGLIMRRQGRSGLALELLRRAVAANGNSAAAHRHLANVLVDAGALDEAIASFDRAIELRPDFAEAHMGRGCTLLNLQRPRAALTSFDQLVRLRPNDAAAHSSRATVLLALGRADEALECCERAEQLAPGVASSGFRIRSLRNFSRDVR